MQNYNHEQSQDYDYRGKRGLVLLRVSTEEQEKKYGFPSQLRSVREKLLEPLGIRILDEEKYIIRDTYTGMEFREREELAKILEMAKRREFDVLIMDVLDRLGRVGLAREIYRAELRINGIRTLTTKPEEHADDDSLMGQMIRLLHGFKSEEERNDIVRRTQNGRRERVLKDNKLLGNNRQKYGFKYLDEDKGSYIVDNDPIQIPIDGRILLDEHGEPWTKAKIRRRMFELADQGMTIRKIAAYLTSQHIPSSRGNEWDERHVQNIIEKRHLNLVTNEPILAYGYLVVSDEYNNPYTDSSVSHLIYGMDDQGVNASKIVQFLNEKNVPTGREAFWHPATVNWMLRDEYVIGKAAVFVNHSVKEPGQKAHVKVRPKDEWVYLPEGVVPPILTTEDGRTDKAWFERVQNRLSANQKGATRNNQDSQSYLLRGGYIKCGYCGGNMTTGTARNRAEAEPRKIYRCSTAYIKAKKCPNGSITAHIADDLAWEKAIEIIRDPLEVDRKADAWKTEDPNVERRQFITSELAKIKDRQKRLRDRLEDEDLDDDTYADVKLRLKDLADQKRGYEDELKIEINIHDEWKKVQDQLKNFHRKCAEYVKKIDDPNYEADYNFKREAIEFFGIVVTVWRTDHKPRIDIQSTPPSIVSSSTSPSYPCPSWHARNCGNGASRSPDYSRRTQHHRWCAVEPEPCPGAPGCL